MWLTMKILILIYLGLAAASHDEDHRRLQTSAFEPLVCNANGFGTCQNFTSIFSPDSSDSVALTYSFTDQVTIACGTCVVMDFPTGATVDFPGSLNVQGKLVFPDPVDPTYQAVFRASAVVVEGELEMKATKTVDGNPNYFIRMFRDISFSFTPADNNENVCGGPCDIGTRGITVAGGKLTIQGVPSDIPTFTKLHDVDYPSAIILPDSVSGKWDAGSEIVLTSNSFTWFADQKRTISSVGPAENGYTRVELTQDLTERPNTVLDDVGFAVEVALLSRNIVFDTQSSEGAHFWIMQTPFIVQHIEGVDIRGFGEAGVLGRYPVHFHLSRDVAGSVVKKNVVQNSRQRCYVIHGTDNVLVEDNVAYNNLGHCYMLEDGVEMGNTFARNIAIRLRRQTVLIDIDGVQESDDECAMFWATNPAVSGIGEWDQVTRMSNDKALQNSWIDNVAAGSEDMGMWFELQLRGPLASLPEYADLKPQYLPITEFSGNEFHAMGITGIRFYLHGYFPMTRQLFKNLKFFRNKFYGIVVFFSRNIHCQNCLFQDNGNALRANQAEEVYLSDSTIVGQSDAYRAVVQAGGIGNPKVSCFGQKLQLYGVNILSTRSVFGAINYETPTNGLFLDNVSFSGFPADACSNGSRAFSVLGRTPSNFGTFDMYTLFSDVTMDPSGNTFEFCEADSIGVDDVYVSSVSSGTAPTTILRNSPELMHFVNGDINCLEETSNCLTKCEGVCFRSVHIYLEKEVSTSLKLRVCDRDDAAFPCLDIAGAVRDNRPEGRFTLHLPSKRRYDAVFVNEAGVPVSVQNESVFYRDALCPLAVPDEDIALITDPPIITPGPTQAPTPAPTPNPTPTPVASTTPAPTDECTLLVEPDDALPSTWGIRGSGFIVNIPSEPELIRWEYDVNRLQNKKHGPEYKSFNTGSRRECMNPGSRWEISALIRLRQDDLFGSEEGGTCDLTSTKKYVGCPAVLFFLKGASGGKWETLVFGYDNLSTWDTSGNFNSFVGELTLPENPGSLFPASRIRLSFANFPRERYLDIKDLRMTKIA